MAMEITNNYSSYAESYTDIAKKSDSKAAVKTNTGNRNSNTNKTQKKYKDEEERWLKAREKREEKKAAEEARFETGGYVQAVVQKVIAASVGTIAPAEAGFDLKA